VIPFPDQEYVARLGRLAYAIGYLEWSILGALPDLASVLPASVRLENIVGETTWSIGQRLAEATVEDPALRAWLTKGGAALKEISRRRNAVLHARPATDDAGRQRLYRWHPRRDQIFWITDEYLDELVEDIYELTRSIDSMRPRPG
jgi:hypothetical protein